MVSRLGSVRAAVACLTALAGGAPLAAAQPAIPPPDTAAAPALPPPPLLGPTVEAPPPVDAPDEAPAPPPKAKPKVAPAAPEPLVLRSPAAVLQVLDKVTAETLRFQAPVGRRVRYKTLVIEVKACETRGLKDPEPKSSAYLRIESRSGATGGRSALAPKSVFRGWMFAAAPGLHALQHPVYDLWLIACSAAAPEA